MNFRKVSSKTSIREFDSIGEMVAFLNNTPDNGKYSDNSSRNSSKSFTLTSSYDEAMKLLLNGWSEAANKMNAKLSKVPATMAKHQRSVYSVAGHTASVPRYLQGIPTSMISSVPEKRKTPVVTINHSICYSAMWRAESIMEEGIKALQLIQSLEASGKRVKLNIICIVEDRGCKRGFKVTIKKPGERLNVSKVAFPLAHPSMLRRLFFKYMEVEPDMPQTFWGYGSPCNNECTKIYADELYIPEKVDLENFKF